MIWILIALVISGCVGLDQWTKYLTVEHLKPIEDFPLIEGWLHLDYVENTGAAFGMLKDHRSFFLVFSTVGILLLLAFVIGKRKQLSLPATIAICMVIGGGIGNQIDRIARGFVVDMIYVKIIDFAVFNVADAFVCVGVGLMVLCLFTKDKWMITDSKKVSVDASAKGAEQDGMQTRNEDADNVTEKETNDD